MVNVLGVLASAGVYAPISQQTLPPEHESEHAMVQTRDPASVKMQSGPDVPPSVAADDDDEHPASSSSERARSERTMTRRTPRPARTCNACKVQPDLRSRVQCGAFRFVAAAASIPCHPENPRYVDRRAHDGAGGAMSWPSLHVYTVEGDSWPDVTYAWCARCGAFWEPDMYKNEGGQWLLVERNGDPSSPERHVT